MKFRDKELTPGEYQYHFLLFIDELAPEVLETLKKLVPKYKEVFGAFEYDHRNYLFGCLIANKTDKGNYILFKLDSSVLSNNPNAPEPSVNEDPILKNFLEFRESFFDFIDRFHLDKLWLKEALFKYLYDLSKTPQDCESLALASDYDWNPYEGSPIKFEFNGWRIDTNSKEFEKEATAAFEDYLRKYIEKTVNQAKADGYKLVTDKRDLERIQWLVLWNKSEFRFLHEIIQPISQHCGVNVTVDVVRKAFKDFEKYELPVRSSKKAEVSRVREK